MKKSSKTTKTINKYVPEWRRVASVDIKYSRYTVAELLQTIKKEVLEDLTDDDIMLEFECDQYSGYYDDVIIESKMNISIRNKK